MTIWITIIDQPLEGGQNTRVMLLAAELRRRGHEVVIWTSAFDHSRKEWCRTWRMAEGDEVALDGGLRVRFLKGCGYRKNISVRRFLDHYLAARDFRRQAARLPRPNLIIASLPDQLTAEAAVRFGADHGIPTVVDIRDKWPDIFAERLRNRWLARGATLALSRERQRSAWTIRQAHAVVAMMDSMLAWGLELACRQPSPLERVFYLTTAPRNFGVSVPTPPPGTPLARALQRSDGRVIFSYVGTFNETQHPALILDAIEQLARDGGLDPDRQSFIIAGDGVGADEIRRRAEFYSCVHVVGWLDPVGMAALLGASHVGLLVLNYATPAFNNKAFSYLASGLPIINGATGDLAEILEREEAGVNVPAADPTALAAAIRRLTFDDCLRARLTANARRVFAERFDRDTNYRNFADHAELVARRARG